MDADPERHLTGTSVFANAQLGFHTWMGLGHAAFWVYCRQDIYMALFSSRPLRVNFSGREAKHFFDLSFTPAPDDTWANRMIWIVAEIVEHCFGAGDHGLYDDLVEKVDRWDNNKPSSFRPIEHSPRSVEANRVFPVIKFAHPWHVTGMQYYHIARIFLALCRPKVPHLGLRYQRGRRAISAEVLTHVRAVCGICCSTSLVTARLTACTALIACGSWFAESSREEQELVLQILKRAQQENAWPTESLSQELMEEWGWRE
ncbi:hypothetical protein LTR67_008762 [Exophiala xenobiotica]